VRRAVVLPLLSAALVACGSSAGGGKPADIAFGTSGGNIRPQRFVIRAGGKGLERQVRADFPALKSRQCPGTLPDFASEYIRFEGRTVRVRGTCEPAFTRLWNKLMAARG
jgi:hypothetical protein